MLDQVTGVRQDPFRAGQYLLRIVTDVVQQSIHIMTRQGTYDNPLDQDLYRLNEKQILKKR
jgi:hypothetical protein